MPLASSACVLPMGRPHWQSATTAILPIASLFQTNVILCQSWNMMLYSQVSIIWQVSGQAGRRTAASLGSQFTSGKSVWQYKVASSQQTKFSDEITWDSLKGMFATNKTGKSYYTLLWAIQFCSILCTNSDICWTALWADSLHLPGKKSHTAKLSSSNPISTGAPLSHRATQQGAQVRLSC